MFICEEANLITVAHRTCYFPALLLLAVLTFLPRASAGEVTLEMLRGRDFKPTAFGTFNEKNAGFQLTRPQAAQPLPKGLFPGMAEFAVHDYKLTSAMIHAVNYGLANLVRAHTQVFGKKIGRNFRVRIRIFGKYDDYAKYSMVKYRKKVNKNLLGYFSNSTREIVTWRQQPHLKWRLMPTVLHEGCHAIMDDIFGELPFWMVEGSADWLGEAPAWLQNGEGLRNDQHVRWIRLDDMRKKGELPPLAAYLMTNNYGQWSTMFKGNIGTGYDVGWSIFDYFIVSSQRANVKWPIQIMAEAVNKAQLNPHLSDEEIFLQTLNSKWPPNPGKNLTGVQSFEMGWHSWIKLEAGKAKKALSKQRSKQIR
jgi:hypothetical protein